MAFFIFARSKMGNMKLLTTFLSGLIFPVIIFSQVTSQNDFKQYFDSKTMRVDYFHTGTAAEEHFSLDRVLNDGPWAGSKTIMLDDLNRGLYFFEISDAKTGKKIYSRGFASIFGEWQTIPEAGSQWGTFHESIRFPWPLQPVKISIQKRDAKNVFVEIWNTEIDPKARYVNPAELKSPLKSWSLIDNGPIDNHVDIVILGDGYAGKEMKKFRDDVTRLTGELFAAEPFKSRKADFNVRVVETPSETSGVNKPHPGIFKRSPLSVSYGAFDSERYALAFDNPTIRDVAATVPYDYMFIVMNENTYGGGGIFNLYSTVCVDNKFSPYIFVHEFGHSFAALADEYYTSDVAYEVPAITVEPWEPNVTALFDPDNLKWKDLVKPGTPVPTPWAKKEFDDFSYSIQVERRQLRAVNVPEEKMEALFEREKHTLLEMISKMEYKDAVGAFEGANYMQYGIYRSAVDCIMFTRNLQQFCPACQRAISQVIDQYSQ